MNTKSVFKNCEYDDKVIKQNISFYLEQCVGYKVDPDNVSFFKVIIDDIDNFLVILKDDVRRLSKKMEAQAFLDKDNGRFLFSILLIEMFILTILELIKIKSRFMIQ